MDINIYCVTYIYTYIVLYRAVCLSALVCVCERSYIELQKFSIKFGALHGNLQLAVAKAEMQSKRAACSTTLWLHQSFCKLIGFLVLTT